MKHITLAALIMSTLVPTALACANPADKAESSNKGAAAEEVKDEPKDQEAVQTPDENQTEDPVELDETTYLGQVKLISSIFEDLQALVEINVESLSPEKSDKVIKEVLDKLVDILRRLPAYHEMEEGTLQHLEQLDLQNSADGLLYPLSDLVAALPKTETNTKLLLAVKSKIELLRKGF